MSHSVFRDLDEDKSSGIGSKSDVADNNLIVFINKDDDVRVDPNALQDFIVNANTDTKSTVSVIRVSSPTPSMEVDEDDDDGENSTKQSDADDDNHSDSDGSSKSSSESDPDSDDDEDSDKHKKSKRKKKKNRNKVRSFGLTVEDFYNPQQAVNFATEIMNIAGITDPKQLKADYEHLRYIIANDHCYTVYTYADMPNAEKPIELADGGKRDAKNKSKLVTSSSTTGSTSTVQSNSTKKSELKKNARNSIVSKSQPTNGLDRDTSNSARNRSVDDANSSTENTGERTSDDEDAESEADEDFSDMTPSESDNDRDSDLDFSVNDCHSRRVKKISKRKIRAKKLAAKKRRRSTAEFSDDGSTPNRKKSTKLPKKSLNTSSKSSTNQTPTSNASSTAAKATTVVASVSGTVKSPATVSTIAKSVVNTPTTSTTTKPMIVTSTPRITKVTYLKAATQNPMKLVGVQKVASSTISSAAATLSTSTPTAATKTTTLTATAMVTATPTIAIAKATASASTPQTTTAAASTPEHKTRLIFMKQKDRKPQQSQHNSLSGMSTLFTPDAIKKHANTLTIVSGNTKNSISAHSVADTKVVQAATSKTLAPITIHAVTTTQSSAQRTNVARILKTPTVVTYPKKTIPKAMVNLASEQDKQLDLINSLVQEELSRTEPTVNTLPQSNACGTVPAAIPNIVKMLETPDAPTLMQTAELSTQQTTSTSNSMSYTTTSSVTDAQMLPDDLLQSFVNNDEYLDDELMKHVATLVEDKNVQDMIDESIGSMSSCSPTIPPAPIQNVATEHKPNEPHPTTVKSDVDEPKTPGGNVAKLISQHTPATAAKEGVKYAKRSDGTFIPLPPIVAPTTRGAKRRAETTPGGSDVQQPKQKVFTVIVQTESSNSPKVNAIGSPSAAAAASTTAAQIIKTPASASTPKAKPIGSRERRASVAIKRSSTESKPRRSMSISNPPPNDGGGGGGGAGGGDGGGGDDDDDDDEDGSDGSYNSEDDPHRLWCICRTPHNNRFMICCDKCEEWFHGKCVGITRQMGREMEQRQSEWICPNCEKKQQPSIKNIFPRKLPSDSPSIRIKEGIPSKSDSTVPNCIVCGIKPSRLNSIYCSDDCIRKHANTTKPGVGSLNASDAESMATTPSLKSPPSEHSERKTIQPKIISQLFKDKANRVVVIDKSTGKYVTGKSAPTADKLQQWLAEHPNYEVLKPGTPQADAFKAKQQQLKSLAKNMNAERELFAVTQSAKIQTKLRFEADKMVYVNPTTHKQVITTTTTALKRSISATSSSSSPVHTKSPVPKADAAKAPKLTSTPAQKTTPSHKKRSSDGKSSTPTQSKSESSSSGSSGERDRLRDNARKSLVEQLMARTKEIADPNASRLTEAEVTEFVGRAEQELFDMNGGDTNAKYKAKYRSLMYNIKDRKNLTLFEKISKKMIEPKQLVRMSIEELASQELAEWRNNENKHQLEMITKSELDMLASGNTYVLKTHKGEEVIQENSERISLDRSLPVEDLVSVLNSSTVSSSDATVAKDRFGKYSSPDGKSLHSSSSKRDSSRSHEKRSDRHESRSGGSSSSSKHKRKRSRERSRERHSSHGHSSSSHSHKDKKERSSGSDSRRDKDSKKEHKSKSSSSSSHSKHHTNKDRNKREASNISNSSNSNSSSSNNKSATTSKAQKTEDISMIDKILKAESTINSILHPEEFKKTALETSNTSSMNVSSGSLNESSAATLTRQPSASHSNESDQEPTSTVTSPPEATPEFPSATPPLTEKSLNPVVWSGNINMIDVATFKVSLSALSGSTEMIEFPKEFDVVGRISPETVWDYLEKIRLSKDIVLLRFSPLSITNDEMAYSTFITYLDSRQRLGVIKVPSKMVKDFYILPLTSHKSLPSILKTTTGFDLGADRPDLLLGIIVRNRATPAPAAVHAPPMPSKYRQPIPFIGHKPAVNIPNRDEHYTPPSSPNINHASISAKQVIKSFASNLDDDEPYSPGGSSGGSDDDDLTLSSIPTTYLGASNTITSITDFTKPIMANANTMSKFDQEKLDELNRQIEAEKKQIAMLGTDIDEPYSPTSSVSPPINPNLSNISIPANLADILKNAFGSSTSTQIQMPLNQYSSMMDTSDTEYVPTPSAGASISYAPALIPPPMISPTASQPSKLAQLTDEELMRLVPDEI